MVPRVGHSWFFEPIWIRRVNKTHRRQSGSCGLAGCSGKPEPTSTAGSFWHNILPSWAYGIL